MNALLRLLAVGGVAASVRRQARLAGLRAAFAAAILVLGSVGGAFLVAAGYQWLRWHFPAPQASAIVGGAFVALAIIVALVGYIVVNRRERRRPAAPAGLDPTAGLAAMAPLAGVLGKVPPAVLAAAIAGFVYGLRGKSK